MIRSYKTWTPRLGEQVYVDQSAQVIGNVDLGDHASVWMCAVIRCFPGRAAQGGDRPPSLQEIANCAPHLEEEIRLFQPLTVIAVGQPAIARLLPDPAPLHERVGRVFQASRGEIAFDVVPLPHPSGRSTWLVKPDNQARLDRALELLAATRGWMETFGRS